MEEYAPRRWRKTLDVRAGVHAINFALGRELFLDTMALGAWLEPEDPRRLRGRAWHGKPNEPNILFELLRDGTVCFEYDGDADEFALETAEADLLRPVTTLDTLGLVGDFDAPLVPWDPTAPANDMQRLGPSLFLKEVELQGGRTYAYKYVANRYRWLWTFADYELDGYGRDFEGRNPCVGGAPLHALRRWGHLTTHADPPALTVEASRTGRYAFVVDLETGAYAVHRMD